jgi:transcriptional regulator with XRE-family HTH domain
MSQTKKYNYIKEVLQERSIKANWLSRSLNVSENSVYNWLSQRSQPSIQTLNEIATLLNVTVSTLVEPKPISETQENQS